MKPTITFVTGNPNKLREAGHILGIELDSADLEIKEIQDVSVSSVVADKARKAYEILKKPVIVEDTGLYFPELGGFPGALVKWMVKKMGKEKMSGLFGGYDVIAETCIGFYDGKEMRIFSGQLDGKIADTPRGESNFGWDPIFIPNGYEKTFAEMSLDEKNKISHRGKAFRKMKEEFLDSHISSHL